MAIPEWIEITGKLAPATVAAAVYFATRSQNRWQNRVSARSAAVDDQKLRLALLDRRVVAIDAVRQATEDFLTNGGATPEIVHNLYEALKVAELVYEREEERAVEVTMRACHQWQFHDRQRERWRDHDEHRLQLAVDAMMHLEVEILAQLQSLGETLRQATRIYMIPPIVPAPTFAGWLRSKLKRRPAA